VTNFLVITLPHRKVIEALTVFYGS